MSRRRISSSIERGSMKESPTRSPVVGAEGHPLDECGVVLHVVKFGQTLCRPGKTRVGRHVLRALAVDEQCPVVAQ
jgi:hypothetical protein